VADWATDSFREGNAQSMTSGDTAPTLLE
jgi:hypothetical protein